MHVTNVAASYYQSYSVVGLLAVVGVLFVAVAFGAGRLLRPVVPTPVPTVVPTLVPTRAARRRGPGGPSCDGLLTVSLAGPRLPCVQIVEQRPT